MNEMGWFIGLGKIFSAAIGYDFVPSATIPCKENILYILTMIECIVSFLRRYVDCQREKSDMTHTKEGMLIETTTAARRHATATGTDIWAITPRPPSSVEHGKRGQRKQQIERSGLVDGERSKRIGKEGENQSEVVGGGEATDRDGAMAGGRRYLLGWGGACVSVCGGGARL